MRIHYFLTEEEIDELTRRGFLKGLGAAAGAAATGSSMAAQWQQKQLKDPLTDKSKGTWSQIKSDNGNALLIIHEYPGPDYMNNPNKEKIYSELKFQIPGEILDFRYVPSDRESYAMGRIKIGQLVKDFILSKDGSRNPSIGYTSSKDLLDKLSKYKGPLKIEMPIYQKGKVIFDFTLDNSAK